MSSETPIRQRLLIFYRFVISFCLKLVMRNPNGPNLNVYDMQLSIIYGYKIKNWMLKLPIQIL